ncbi:MAG: DinB family protein [Phycisphaerae bacterium]
MANHLLETGVATLAFSRQATMALIDTLSEDQFLHQPCPGANHALWIMGHLACSDEFFLNKLGDKPFDKFESWESKFFMKSLPTANASDYPPVAEVKEALANGRERLVGWYGTLDEATLLSPPPDDLKDFAPTHAALLSTIVWHEGMHAGQLTVIRKSLGLAPVFG